MSGLKNNNNNTYKKYMPDTCIKEDVKCNTSTFKPQKNTSNTSEYYECDCNNNCHSGYQCTNNINSFSSINPTPTPIPRNKVDILYKQGKLEEDRCVRDLRCDSSNLEKVTIDNIDYDSYDCSCTINKCKEGFKCHDKGTMCIKKIDCSIPINVVKEESHHHYKCKCGKDNLCHNDYKCSNNIEDLKVSDPHKCIKFMKNDTIKERTSSDGSHTYKNTYCGSFNKCDKNYICSNDNNKIKESNRCVKPLECRSTVGDKYSCACDFSTEITCKPGYACSNSSNLLRRKFGNNKCVTQVPSMQPDRLPSKQPSMQPSKQPSMQPSKQPSMQPSKQPSKVPN